MDKKKLQEQEGGMDGGAMDTGGSPGVSHQVPASLAGSMDDYSLLGTSQNKKKGKKKKKKPHPNNRVLTFKDFIGKTPK